MNRLKAADAVRAAARQAAIERIAAAAPPLTAEQLMLLRRIFSSAPARIERRAA